MELGANKLADKADSTSQLTLLAKSNALRRGAVSKRAEIKEMDAVIAEHEKNCLTAVTGTMTIAIINNHMGLLLVIVAIRFCITEML